MNRRRWGAKNGEDNDNGFAEWGGYMALKKIKLLEQFHDKSKDTSSKESNLFNGISIFVNGYTDPSAEELKRIMVLHGGEYHHYYTTSRTTYIIASNLPDAKIKQIGPNKKIIKPEWITECLKSGKLLDYANYLLYTNSNRKQPRLNFEKIVKDEETKSEIINTIDDENFEISPELFGSCEDNFENKCEQDTILKNQIGVDDTDNVKVQSKTNNLDTKLDITDIKLPETTKTINLVKPGRTLTANDPKFLSEFYNNSRLHHISTLGATFKQHVCDLREQSSFKFPERQKLTNFLNGMKREQVNNFSLTPKQTVIMHIDMDCFFVSVGLRKRPDLRGVPVAVTHSKGGQEPSFRSGVDRQAELDCYKKRIQEKLNLNMSSRLEGIENQSMSEIASCSYEARKAGVKNGMFMGTALKLCPNLQTIPYDFDGYKEVAYALYNTISEYTLNIEAVSCDEMFVDITELLNETGASVNEWATYIRNLIQSRTGCPCSTGFGQNRLQARVATKTAKPNGQFHLIPDAVEEYMVDIKVDDLPGVGRSTALKLESFGVKTCGDLQSMSIGKLRSEFGNKIGESLYNHCRGIDDRKLVYEHERKSVSAEVNYGIRFKNNTEAETFLKQLVSEVHSRLIEIKMKGKSITLKLMVRSKDAPEESSKFMGHGICDYITKSNSLSVATNDLNVIEREILSIAQKLSIPPQDLRGIGIQIAKLEKIKNISGGISKYFNAFNSSETTENKTNSEITIINNLKPDNDWEINCQNTTIMNNNNIKNENENPVLKLPNYSPIKNLFNVENASSIIQKKSPEKKPPSPVKNNRTMSKRGRGRPRGGRGGKTIERKNSNNGDLTKFFTAASSSTSNNSDSLLQKQVQLNGIDMEVFDALPEDIRNEILAELQPINVKTVNTKLESPNKINNDTVDEKIVNNLNDERSKISHDTVNGKVANNLNEERSKISHEEKLQNQSELSTVSEIPENIPSTSNKDTEENENCMFSKMNIKEMKTLLEDWISSQSYPELCDISMLGEYFKQLALDRKIGILFEILKFIYSEISLKNDCKWHEAYFKIVNIAQDGMKEQYGSSIHVYKDFKCKNMCHLQNK